MFLYLHSEEQASKYFPPHSAIGFTPKPPAAAHCACVLALFIGETFPEQSVEVEEHEL